MISEDNQTAIQAAGLSFILGTRIAHLPDVIRRWRDTHPGHEIPDGHVFTQPWPATAAEKARGILDRVIYFQYRHDRARRTLRGIYEQVAKAENAVAGRAPVKRNRYIKLSGATKSVNRDLETKTRAMAGLKGYTTNLTGASAEFVIDAYHPLWRIEKSFRVSKHDLQARPVYHQLVQCRSGEQGLQPCFLRRWPVVARLSPVAFRVDFLVACQPVTAAWRGVAEERPA